MKKSDLLNTIKIPTSKWHALFSVSFAFFFSTIILNAQAQCPTITARASLTTICSGTSASITLTSNQIGTTFSWTIVQENVAGAADGTGSGIAQTLTATGAATGYVVYTITPLANGCKGAPSSIEIKVNPVPVIIATPLTSTIASNTTTAIALTSDVAETAFSWTVIQSGVTRAKAGSGSVIDQILSTNADKGIATYRITPNFNGCAGQPINAKVIVKR